MKITKEHFAEMQLMIEGFIDRQYDNGISMHDMVEVYCKGQFPRSSGVKDLQKRFCFDLWREAGGTYYARSMLYSYVNDGHIYTALKRILPTVTREY